ncbi:MAG: ABC transporter ATP-binding protein [Chloroflexales bacterium]
MNPSRQRLIKWATRGALILAALAIFLGAIFTILVAVAEDVLPVSAFEWARMMLGVVVLWGGGGLFFGAILGTYACMIWRDPHV